MSTLIPSVAAREIRAAAALLREMPAGSEATDRAYWNMMAWANQIEQEAEQSDNAYLDELVAARYAGSGFAHMNDEEGNERDRAGMRAVLAKLEADGRLVKKACAACWNGKPANPEPNRVPRVWKAGDPEPEGVTKVRDSLGPLQRIGGRWRNGNGEPIPFWDDLAFPVTEVLPEKETE